jgi:uncharacterized protein DUF1207
MRRNRPPYRRGTCILLPLLLLLLSPIPGALASGEDDEGRVLSVAEGVRLTLSPTGAYLPENVTFRLGDLRSSASITRITVPGASGSGASVRTERRGNLRIAETTLPLGENKQATLRTTLRSRRPAMQIELSGTSELVIRIAGVTRLIRPESGAFAAEPLASLADPRAVTGRLGLQDAESGFGLVVAMPTGGRMEVHLEGVLAEVRLIGSGDEGVSAVVTAFQGDALSALERAEEPGRPGGTFDPTSANRRADLAELLRIPPLGHAEAEHLLFPNRSRAFRPLLADQREAQIRAGFATHRHGDVHADLALGGDLGLVRHDYGPDDAMTFSIRTLFTARLNMSTESADLLNTDYQGGFALGRRLGDDAWEVYLYHQSSHLGDETLDFGKRARIDYGRETIRFLWSREIDKLRIYAGPSFNCTAVNSDFRRKTKMQIGAEYRFEGFGMPMYIAADLQSRENNDWRPGFTAQYGVEFGDPAKIDPRPRLFFEFFTGFSNMGQYWKAYENSFMVGVGYEF